MCPKLVLITFPKINHVDLAKHSSSFSSLLPSLVFPGEQAQRMGEMGIDGGKTVFKLKQTTQSTVYSEEHFYP